jgi:hypothetical protein
MVATPGTIPAMTPYQPGALPWSGQEVIEIASSNNATVAVTGYVPLTDVLGKGISQLPLVVPTTADRVAIFQASTGLPKSATFGSISVPAGNVNTGGGTGTLYVKNSATNFDASFTTTLPCNGTPTGIPNLPNGTTGHAPMVFDTANNKLWFYNGAWKGATFS